MKIVPAGTTSVPLPRGQLIRVTLVFRSASLIVIEHDLGRATHRVFRSIRSDDESPRIDWLDITPELALILLEALELATRSGMREFEAKQDRVVLDAVCDAIDSMAVLKTLHPRARRQASV